MEHIPNVLDCVRMFRAEFDLSFDDAILRTAREFEKKGWPIPPLFQSIVDRRK